MKYLLTIFLIINLSMSSLFAQNIKYPEGDILLNLNENFGSNTNWLGLSTASEQLYSTNYKNPASFTLSKDGNFYLINNIQKELQLFDAGGNFIKTLSKITNISKYRVVTMAGILDGKYIVTQNYNKLHIFNIDGSLFKIINLDYPVSMVVPLKENVVAMYAQVVYPGRRIKRSIILKNIITNNEKEIEFEMSEFNEDNSVTLKRDDKTFGFTFPFSKGSYIINQINTDQLLVGYTMKPELRIYNYQGKLISTFDTKINQLDVSQSAKQEFLAKIKDEFYKAGYKEQYDKNPVLEKSLPSKLPFFHSMKVDNDNNILVFLFTEEKKGYTASIYSTFSGNGKYLGTSTFQVEKYNLNINPSAMTIKFGDHQIHAIVREGDDPKSPFKLLNFTF